MTDRLAEALLRYTEKFPGEVALQTAIEGLFILRSDYPKPPAHRLARPALCIVAQGAKWATFGGSRLEYKAGEALVIGVETPTVGKVVAASADKPCLVLVIELDLAIARDVAERMTAPPKPSSASAAGVFVTDFQGPLSDCALRLVRLLETPDAIPALQPLIMREICYWLLAGPHGGDIARMTMKNGPSVRVIDAMRSLQSRFNQPLRVEELASIARMSASAFHRQFKSLTGMTPVQYQKQLRLLEARRLMISRNFNVEMASFEVGYESPSQFSREYVRMFGTSPKRDATQMQSVIRRDHERDRAGSLADRA